MKTITVELLDAWGKFAVDMAAAGLISPSDIYTCGTIVALAHLRLTKQQAKKEEEKK